MNNSVYNIKTCQSSWTLIHVPASQKVDSDPFWICYETFFTDEVFIFYLSDASMVVMLVEEIKFE